MAASWGITGDLPHDAVKGLHHCWWCRPGIFLYALGKAHSFSLQCLIFFMGIVCHTVFASSIVFDYPWEGNLIITRPFAAEVVSASSL